MELLRKYLHLPALGILIIMLTLPAHGAEPEVISAKDDYVTCWKQPCVYAEGSKWSENCPQGVGVSVRMGTVSAVTDAEIKQVVLGDLKYYKVKDIRFFYENFKGKSTAISLHVRGGTEGTFFVNEIRGELKATAKRALNANPLFTSMKEASENCSYQ